MTPAAHHAGGGLVQVDDLRVPQQRHGHAQAALHAAAVAAAAHATRVGQLDLLQQVGRMVPHLVGEGVLYLFTVDLVIKSLT